MKLFGIRCLPMLSSVCIGLAFLSPYLCWTVFVGVLPWLYYVRRFNQLRAKQIIVDCWLAALLFSLFNLAWMLQTNPSSWMNVQSGPATILKTAIWLVASLFGATGFGLVLGFILIKLRRRGVVVLLAAFPFAWIAAELARSYSLALFTLGPGSSFSPNWNFGSLGLAVSNTPLVYLSRFFGLFGLSAAAVLINLGVYLLIRRHYKYAAAIAAAILVLTGLAWGIYRPTASQTADIVVANLQNPTDSLWNWHDVLPNPPKNADLLVLPEYAYFFDNPDYRHSAQQLFGPQTTVITSRTGPGTPKTNQVLYYANNHPDFVSVQTKTFLAPFGEYLPYDTSALLKVSGQQKVIDSFTKNSLVRKGTQPEHAVQSNGLAIGALACSGVLNLDEYQRLSREGAQVLTSSASLKLLEHSNLYHLSEQYQNRFHAVANARPFVQAARSSRSYVYSSDGKLLVSSRGKTELLEVKVPLQSRRTLYSLL